VFQKRIHVFKAGDQTSAQGVQRHFSEKDLEQVVKTYDPSIHEAPLVIGHAGDNDSLPAYGWIKGFSQQGGNLYADVAFTDTAKDLVKDGHYRKVSISFYSPDSAINPHKGKWSARHLALLGASPPAVKGLEPFTFAESDGVFDFAVALAPSDIFDEELGPTLIVEKSPLEMLREKLDEVREDVSSAVKDLQSNQQSQPTEQLEEVATSSVTEEPEAAQMANPDAPQFKETSKNVGREGTEISQQTADLETQFPEEEFMEKGKISRKHEKGAHGQVMQVVENVYEEAHKESTDERKAAADRAFEAKRLKKEGKDEEAKEVKRFGKEEDKLIKEAKHSEDDMTDSGVMKRHGGDGGPGSADHAELEYDEVSYKTSKGGKVHFGTKKEEEGGDEGRYDTARSDSNGYVDRMKTGKAGADARTGRMQTAKSGEQDRDRMHTAENGEQDKDRMHTAKNGEFGKSDTGRWAGQEDGYDQVTNNDQYDAGKEDYPEGSRPEESTGTDPYGRKETATKIPVETEEMPDNEVFAVQTQNVMSDKNMRVLRQTSSQGREAVKGGAIPAFAEPQADEMTGDDGVTTAKKGMTDAKTVEHGEGAGKPSKDKQLTPGAMDTTDDPAEIVGPSGAFAESYKGEKKATGKQLTPGAMDEVDDPAEIVGPGGAYAEGKASKSKQLTPGAMDTVTDPAEITKKSGGVYAEEHGEKKDPYTKTGFGSTGEYLASESEEEMEGDATYGEYSVDHCGMDYGMGSMSQAAPVGMGIREMAEELANLKRQYAELEKRNRMEKMSFRQHQLSEAIGHMYTEGRLTDGIMPEQELLSYVEGLEFGTLEFSEGETAATKLLTLLSKLPPMVSFGEVAGGTFQYAEEDLDPHAKALRMVEESDGQMDYVEALKKTMFS